MAEENKTDSASSSSDEKMTDDNESAQAISSSSASSSSSSSSEQSSIDDDDRSSASESSVARAGPTASRGYSRLFSPYRTLGIVADGPFHLIPNQNSSNAMVCASIGERFHLVQCDRLHPVMVSHALPGIAQADSKTEDGGPQKISRIVSDNTLSIAVVAHGFTAQGGAKRVSLFQRTQSVATLDHLCEPLDSNSSGSGEDWSIADMLHLGKIKMTMTGEKQDKKENAALIAVVLSKGKPYDDSADGVPVVGEEDEDSSDDDSDSDNNSEDERPQTTNKASGGKDSCRGQVVLLVASRTSLAVHKRIPLKKFSAFCPRVSMHPPTYVNKIVIGGSCSKTSRDAMILLNVRTGKIIHTFKCLDKHAPSAKSEITSLEASPAIDTIATGNSKGVVHLINLRCDKLLFSLRHEPKPPNSKKSVRITSMSFRTDGAALKYGIAPLAVGRSDGTITVWDLSPPSDDNDDEDGDDHLYHPGQGRSILCEIERAHYPGGVCKLQYLPQEPLLVSTGTRSNSLVMHIFDSPDHSGRILRQRRGHTAPPRCIRYLHPGAGAGGGVLANMGDGTDAHACQIVSGGSTDRTVRKFSTVRSVLDREFSQGKGLEKKARELGMLSKTQLLLPPVAAMTTSEMRSRDWGDLVSIHKDHAFAYVWSSKNGTQSGPVLRQDTWNVSVMKKQPPESAHATSVSMSTCGNYALVGTKGGVIYRYNVQSGMARGTYPIHEKKKGRRGPKVAGDVRRTFKALEKKMKLSNRASNQEKEEHDRIIIAKRDEARNAKFRLASHEGYAVTGIAVDSVNRTVISVGADSKLILWNFATHAPHKKSPSLLPAPATKLCHVKDSDLAAIALEDFSAVLFDCSTLTIVRRFGVGNKFTRHTGPISDFGFSPDARTLYTSSMDGTIRVWDVPTNSCVDWMSFDTPPTSLTVSPTGEFLATTHTGKLGISLWSDRSFYQTVHVDGTLALTEPSRMDDPAPIAEVENDEDNDDVKNLLDSMSSGVGGDEKKSSDPEESATGPAKAREEGLITLSGLPQAHWKNLFHLELVKQRNKPKEAPKKPPSAPFFLQWRPGINAAGEPSTNVESNDQQEAEKNDDDQWDAVWSDDDDDEKKGMDVDGLPAGIPSSEGETKRSRTMEDEEKDEEPTSKRRKVSIYRSQLASLLQECADKAKRNNHHHEESNAFAPVTEYVGTLGPSAIDVSLTTLCNGTHDLEDGLPLLILAARWLVEACHSRERFDAVNAYLHRFLYLHASILSGIDEDSGLGKNNSEESEKPTAEEVEQKRRENEQRRELAVFIGQLKQAQKEGSATLQEEMQNTLCLLRHFSRMV